MDEEIEDAVPVLDINAIWGGDALGRKHEAERLQSYLCNRYKAKPDESGFVLAVDAEWGYGKSFFIERWCKQNQVQQYPVVFFDAWQNDFAPNALLAFIAELDSGLEEFFSKIPLGKRIAADARDLLKATWNPALKVLASAVLKHGTGLGLESVKSMLFTDDGTVSDNTAHHTGSAAEVMKSLETKLNEALKGHKSTKDAIKLFKVKLSMLIAQLGKEFGIQLPLFVFVDELDRCRPDYAIELLEGIKHLFGVPGVYFIVATNKHQLGASIKAVYGAEFDGHRYLKRFFDLSYSMQKPSTEEFARSLFGRMNLPSTVSINHGLPFGCGTIPEITPRTQSCEVFAGIFVRYVGAFDLSLRDQIQVASIIENALIQLEGHRIHVYYLFFLAALYHRSAVVYKQVTEARALTAPTGILEICLQNDLGCVSVFGANGQLRNVNVFAITKMYLDNLNGVSVPVNTHSLFPESLLLNVSQKNGVLDYECYPDVISFASRLA